VHVQQPFFVAIQQVRSAAYMALVEQEQALFNARSPRNRMPGSRRVTLPVSSAELFSRSICASSALR
jgi:hypothetical protein